MTDLLTVKDVMARTKLSEPTIYRACRDDAKPRLTYVQIGGVRRFRESDVAAWIDAQAVTQ